MMNIIGIDAGGTKTQAVVYSEDKRVLHTCITGMGNMNVDRKMAIQNILQAIDEALPYVEDKAFICVGAAGITAEGNEEALQEALLMRYKEHRIHITSDAALALYAKLEGKDGLLLISGTGSVVFGKVGNVIERVGGWGHILGDEGSGYAISLAALKNMFHDRDAGRPQSVLSKRLLQVMETESIYEVIKLVYHQPKGDVAALFREIVNMANLGDQEAQELLIEGANDLANMVKTLVDRMHIDGTVNIALSGSVVTRVARIQDRLLDQLSEMDQPIKLVENENEAPVGAVYIYDEVRNKHVGC